MFVRIQVAVMSAALFLYLCVAVIRGIDVLKSSNGIAVFMGISLLVLPLIALWLLIKELSFGYSVTRLGNLFHEQNTPDRLVDVEAGTWQESLVNAENCRESKEKSAARRFYREMISREKLFRKSERQR